MGRIFDTVVDMSLIGIYTIFIVLFVRLLLRKLPRRFSYALWFVVFLRLVCPVMPTASYSLIPAPVSDFMTKSAGTVMQQNSDINTNEAEDLEQVKVNADPQQPGMTDRGQYAGYGVGKADTQTNGKSTHLSEIRPAISILWLVVALALMCYHYLTYMGLGNRLKRAVSVQQGVYEIPGAHLSFVYGIVKPKIYLSSGLNPDARDQIVCHERVHIARRDYLIKPLALVICCVHWFNPFVWLAFYLMNQDMEISCDEQVIRQMGEKAKKSYSRALLDAARMQEMMRGKKTTVCALLSFGEDSVKVRIKHVLRTHKTPIGLSVAAVILVVAVTAGLLFNPVGSTKTDAHSSDAAAPGQNSASELQDQLETAEGAKQKLNDMHANVIQTQQELSLEEDTGQRAQETLSDVTDTLQEDRQAYEDFTASLEPDHSPAYVTLEGLTNPLLLVSSGTYQYDDALYAALECQVYYVRDGRVQLVGELQSGGTAYPIAADATGIYAAGGHNVARYTFDEETMELVFAEAASELFEPVEDPVAGEEAPVTYYYETPESGEQIVDSSDRLDELFQNYSNAYVVSFDVTAKLLKEQ